MEKMISWTVLKLKTSAVQRTLLRESKESHHRLEKYICRTCNW